MYVLGIWYVQLLNFKIVYYTSFQNYLVCTTFVKWYILVFKSSTHYFGFSSSTYYTNACNLGDILYYQYSSVVEWYLSTSGEFASHSDWPLVFLINCDLVLYLYLQQYWHVAQVTNVWVFLLMIFSLSDIITTLLKQTLQKMGVAFASYITVTFMYTKYYFLSSV